MPTHILRRAAALALALVLSAPLAVHASSGPQAFADFRIDASAMDFPQQTIAVQIYRPDGSGKLQLDDSLLHPCTLNRVTGDASFFIQPKTSGVWATVDYLTDRNGDGIYEMIDWQDKAPGWSLVPQADATLLPSTQQADLSQDQTYVLTARALLEGGEVAQLAWSDGSATPPAAAGPSLYLVNLHHAAAGGQSESQSYYLKLYGQVLIPDDVSPSAPCYQAVEHCLAKGYLSNTGAGKFSPDRQLDRAQLAQILWRMGGSLSAPAPSFRDVSPSDWSFQAVAWCHQEGLMSGTGPDTFSPLGVLTREQVALILFQYASRTLPELESASLSLDKFPDAGSVSSWAEQGVAWAVVNGLLSPLSDGSLHPQRPVTRADMATILYLYDTQVSS